MGTQTSTQTQTKDPWGPAQPYLKQIMGEGQSLYNTGAGSSVYGGQRVADLNPTLMSGVNTTNSLAGADTSGGYNAAMQSIAGNGLSEQQQGLLGQLGAIGQNPGQNPYLQQMMDANAARASNRAASLASGSGRYGSGGHTDLLVRSIAEANNPLMAQAYESDQSRRLQALGQSAGIMDAGMGRAQGYASMLPQLNALRYSGADRQLGVGGMLQSDAQQRADAERQRWEEQNNMPWQQLNRYQGAVSGLGGILGNAGTTTGTTSTPTPWTQYAGLGIAGLGLLSDRTEKTDIKKLGKDHETGLTMYSYRYKDDPKSYPKVVGPMAQEIAEKYPGATHKVAGKLYVKPAAVGLLGM